MFGKLPKVIAGAAFALGFSTFRLLYAAPDPNFHIYIAYGQSNMGGTADAQSADKAEHPRFKIFATQKCSGRGGSVRLIRSFLQRLPKRCENDRLALLGQTV